jgi:hypothetical protein
MIQIRGYKWHEGGMRKVGKEEIVETAYVGGCIGAIDRHAFTVVFTM